MITVLPTPPDHCASNPSRHCTSLRGCVAQPSEAPCTPGAVQRRQPSEAPSLYTEGCSAAAAPPTATSTPTSTAPPASLSMHHAVPPVQAAGAGVHGSGQALWPHASVQAFGQHQEGVSLVNRGGQEDGTSILLPGQCACLSCLAPGLRERTAKFVPDLAREHPADLLQVLPRAASKQK